MTRFKLTSLLCIGSFALLTTLPGCGSRKDSDDATASDGSSSGTQGGSSTGSVVPTDGTATESGTTGEPTAGSMTATDSGSGSTTVVDTTVTTGAPACDDLEGQPNNSTCMDASGCGCASGKCFIVPALGGYCGECLGDADCAATGGGCTVPNPIAEVGSTCNTGQPGEGCETNDICATDEAAFCGKLLEVPGIISVSTCGACATNDECIAADAALPNCSPTYDVMNFSGQYVCVADGSVANNGGCNLAKGKDDLPVGNAACESGFCGEANVMGLVKLGICGECETNADCVKIGKTMCSDPSVDLVGATLQGAVCT